MQLDSVNVDCVDPERMAAFWGPALGLRAARSDAGGVALALPGNGLELWFLRVPGHRPQASPRVHFDLDGEHRRDEIVAELLALGAVHKDIGQHDVPWTVLADPENNAFCVIPGRDEQYRNTGRLASLPYDCSDPEENLAFWLKASGWEEFRRPSDGFGMIQHPSHTGLVIGFCPEEGPKTDEKNWLHFDLRLDPGEDEADALARLESWGATILDHGWGELDWTVLADPSGNEFCLLRAR